MKTKLIASIIIGVVIISSTSGYLLYQDSLCKSSSGYMHNPRMNSIWDCLQFLSELKPSPIEPEPEDVLGIAQEFIKSSPTFAFDGIDETLSLELVFIRESFPEQYVIEADFDSLHGGYGDRTDQMVIQVITSHTMNLVVISGQVTSAIIDGKWDELNQIELPWTPITDPNETVSHVNEVVDYVSLIDNLRANDATINPEGEIEQPFFSVTGFSIQVDGASVQVFEYNSAEDAEADVSLVSSDGSSIGTSMPFWVDDPHFYYKEKIIVLYIGDDPTIEKLLESVLGNQFAGR